MTKIAVFGAAGRMGLALIRLIQNDPTTRLEGAIERDDHPQMGVDAGLMAGLGDTGVLLTSMDDFQRSPDVLIDFSHHLGAKLSISFCLQRRIPLVMATTGLDEVTIANLTKAAEEIPIVWAPNMSLAVNLTMKLVEVASRALTEHNVDVEIIERHHRFKADSPSGTALKFGQIVSQLMGQTNDQHGRFGMIGQRPQGEIGYHAIRAGDNPGEHTIIFGMLGETIELKVAASNRDCYAQGAIAAAKFLKDRPAGMFDMFDVLNLVNDNAQVSSGT